MVEDELEQIKKDIFASPSKKLFFDDNDEDIEPPDDLRLIPKPKQSPLIKEFLVDDGDIIEPLDEIRVLPLFDDDQTGNIVSSQQKTAPSQSFIFLSDEEDLPQIPPHKRPVDIMEQEKSPPPPPVHIKKQKQRQPVDNITIEQEPSPPRIPLKFEFPDASSDSSFRADLSAEDSDDSFDDEAELPIFHPKLKIGWTRTFDDLPGESWLPEFKMATGPQHCLLTPESDPLDYFSLIFPEDLIKDIMKWTNTQAKLKIDNGDRRKQKKLKWRDMNMSEMKAFLGCVFTMTIVRLPNTDMYWNQRSRLFNPPGIRDLFSEQRFSDIFRNLSFCVQNNRHARIEAMSHYIISNSQFFYTPNRDLSLDESMIAFQGRCADKVYMPRKPIRHGLKAYVLCESDTGYVVNWALHIKEKKNPLQPDYYKTKQIVMRLLEGLEGEGYCVYMDRFYSTIPLFLELRKLNIGACATIQISQLHLDEKSNKLIKDIAPTSILYFNYSSDLLLAVWKDARAVFMLSNFHKQVNIEVERRTRKKERSSEPGDQKEEVTMPKCVFDYNHKMGGVDTLDQLLSYYELHRRSRKWVLKVFFHLLEIAFVNSYIIYSKVCQRNNVSPVLRLEFRKGLIRNLINEKRNELNIPHTEKKAKKKKEEEEEKEKDLDKFWVEFKESTQIKRKGRIDVSELVTEICKEECHLEKIPKQEYKKTTRLRCQICRTSSTDNHTSTSYWCSTHGAPVCHLECYDTHRRRQMEMILQKRIKKDTAN